MLAAFAVTLRSERSEPRRVTAWADILRGPLCDDPRMTNSQGDCNGRGFPGNSHGYCAACRRRRSGPCAGRVVSGRTRTRGLVWGTAPGALALLDKTSELDLLFTNVDLKDEIAAGIELAQQAAKRKPNLKVLYTTERSLTDGMKARFVKNSAFLAKPYTVEQLLTTLSVHFRISPQARRQPANA